MFTKKDFFKQAQAIKILEEQAEKRYADLIGELSDVKSIEILTPVKEDEQKHQRIMREIIDITENNKAINQTYVKQSKIK